jgi:hypothetical protein
MMHELRIPATTNLPEIFLSPDGFIKVKGRSIHENIFDFFKPVELWIRDYIKTPAEMTVVDIELEYCNSASSKLLINIIQQISQVRNQHRKLQVNWYYEDGDEDILERGEYFSSILSIPFNFIKIK